MAARIPGFALHTASLASGGAPELEAVLDERDDKQIKIKTYISLYIYTHTHTYAVCTVKAIKRKKEKIRSRMRESVRSFGKKKKKTPQRYELCF